MEYENEEIRQKAKELEREYNRAWREKNKEHIKNYHKQWRKENPDKIKQSRVRYWEKKVKANG